MIDPALLRRLRPVRRRPRRWLYLIAILCVAVIVVEVGLVTHWFGLQRTPGSPGGSSPPPATNPNPYNQTVRGLHTSVGHTGVPAGAFPSV